MANKIFNCAKKFLPLIGIIIFIYLLIDLDLERIKNAFLSIHPIYILLSISLTIPTLIVKNYTWQLVQKEQKIKLSFIHSLKILLIGSFYSVFTPGYLGHLIRVPYMKEKTGEPYGKLFVNVFIDTSIRTTIAFLMMLVGSLLVIGMYSQLFTYVLIIFAIWAVIILYFLKRERGEKLFNNLIKYFLPRQLRNSSYQFVSTFYTDFPELRRLILPTILNIFVWVLVFSQKYIFILALGINIPYIYFLFIQQISSLTAYIPITVAGLGSRELMAIWLYSTLFAAPKEGILVITLAGFLVTEVFVGFLGFIVSLTEAGGKDFKDLENMITKN